MSLSCSQDCCEPSRSHGVVDAAVARDSIDCDCVDGRKAKVLKGEDEWIWKKSINFDK